MYFYIIREGHYEIENYLINKGAEIAIIDKKKKTPISILLN